ncbi:hypothetical protein [Streptomyces yangpuensis]|uniref:hypothetical protein n=1 Tax=Streptomyces yangpuensis TaxID=1648182 RepID=UPI003826DEB7
MSCSASSSAGPEVALRLLYEQTASSWAMATAMLENAVAPLLDALGPDAPFLLDCALRGAAACTSAPGDTEAPSLYGVRAALGE